METQAQRSTFPHGAMCSKYLATILASRLERRTGQCKMPGYLGRRERSAILGSMGCLDSWAWDTE